MTHFLQDILRQPAELCRVITYLGEAGKRSLESAARAIRGARHVYLTGIGASWNAALNVGSLFYSGGRPVYMLDAGELLEFSQIPPESVILIISRSGRSVEILRLLAKAREAGATVIGVTSSENGPLAREAHIPLVVPVVPDHGISVNTYSGLAATAGAIAAATVSSFDTALAASLSRLVAAADSMVAGWQQQLAETHWLLAGATYYFLARGSSLGSCYGARLLWEEGVKSPATCMGTGSFRHGPLEMVTKGVRFGLWIDGEHLREQDLAVARDLQTLGAAVMLVGRGLPKDAADLVFELPDSPREWQFLVDIIPAQLAAENLARLSGVDCDSFRYASFIVEDDHGLIRNGGPAQQISVPTQPKG